jgi:hypothetical protein
MDLNKPIVNNRTLIFSQRKMSRIQPFRCAHFEFEDVIAEIDNADFVAPRFNPLTLRHSMAKKLAYHTPVTLNPGVEQVPIEKDYELFFAICGDPTDLLRINSLADWRSKCKTAICLIDELWVRQLTAYRKFLRLLDKFDLVILYYSQTIAPLGKMIKTKCVFMPPGVDAIRFCPYPNAPKRVVDIYSIGRRSAVSHRAFLKMAAKDGLFYLHDTTSADHVIDPIEHRVLFANVAKRSRYFIVNPGLIDRPDIRGNQIEIGNRYFEAAASGCIMLGERPRNSEFEKHFGWPDAVIDLPYDSPDAEEIVKEFDEDPGRQCQLRQTNIQQSLLHHDWVYRWEEILRKLGIPPLPQLDSRKERLRHLAEEASQKEVAEAAIQMQVARNRKIPGVA